jgi:signal transduction histidine kinase
MQPSLRRLFPRRIDERRLTIAIRALFGISIILISVLWYQSNKNIQNVLYYSQKTEHSRSVITELSQLQTQFYRNLVRISATNGTDKGAITSSNLEINATLTRLDSLCNNSQVQLLRLKDIKQATSQGYSLLQIPDSSFSIRGNLEKTYEYFYTADSTINKMLEIEGKLYNNRQQSKLHYKNRLDIYNMMILLVSVGFLGTFFVLLDREHSRNRYYRKILEEKIVTLKQSNHELEQYAYVASHDLQEPIRKIIAFSDRLIHKHKSALETEAFPMLEKINKSATRMQFLINDLLMFSKISKPDINKTETSLNEILEEVLENLNDDIQKKGAIIHSEILPPAYVYPIQIFQLFQNLLSNSLKYSKPDVPPRINIKYEVVIGHEIPDSNEIHKESEFYKIDFEDNGIGFNQEYADKIFVIFQRLHGKEKFHGTGIGLAICKKVVVNHEGYISAYGKEQKGAVFSVYLPA